MMRQDTIHINDLSIGYRTKNDTKLVASHIQARIYSGELTCLLGANGVGKSTLLRTLSAFQQKLGGEIAVLGRDMDSYSDKELSTTIGVVLTEKCDIRNMSVRELVEMGRSPYTGFWGRLDKEDKQVVEESIALVRIENLASRMVYTLSDGERQKVMIAKALAQERNTPDRAWTEICDGPQGTPAERYTCRSACGVACMDRDGRSVCRFRIPDPPS